MPGLQTPKSVGVIVCSNRQPRVCPQIVDYVVDAIQEQHQNQLPSEAYLTPTTTYKIIDLAEVNLPFFDEPGIPARINDPANYAHEHTRAWSMEISSHDALIFVTPQYNWGYPAVLKNAIDFLFHEWAGKPCMIVTYGGHGGGKCAQQLRIVLEGAVKAAVAETMPALQFPNIEVKIAAATGKKVELGKEGGVWVEERDTVRKAWGEVMTIMKAASGV